jgi:hypothetical protein
MSVQFQLSVQGKRQSFFTSTRGAQGATGLIVSGCQGQRYPDAVREYLLLLNYLFNFRIFNILRTVSNYAGREHCGRNYGIMLLGPLNKRLQ